MRFGAKARMVLLIVASRLSGLALAAPAAGRPRRTSSPPGPRPPARPTAAGRRAPATKNAGKRGLLHGRHPGPVLRTGRRPPAGRLHPVHRQAPKKRSPACGTRSANCRRCASTCRSGWRSTPRRRRSAPSANARKPARKRCPAGYRSRRELRHGARSPACRRPCRPRPSSTTSCRPRGSRRASVSNLLGNDVYLEADVAWESDFHEGFTIHVPETPFAKALELGLPLPAGRRRLEEPPGLRRALRRRDVHHHADHLPRPGHPTSPFEHIYSTWLLRPTPTRRAGYHLPRRLALPRVADPARH